MQNFVMEKIKRSQLNKAKYNPRKIKEENKKRLKEGIERVGLVSPITVNKRTMNIVGGHQRIDILDSLEETDYSLDVAMIDVDLTKEKEINVMLNNTSMMGEFDFELLSSMNNDVDFTKLGFSDIEISMFGKEESMFDVNDVDSRDYNKLDREEAEQIRERHLETKVAVSNYFTLIFDSDVDKHHFCERLGLSSDKNSIRFEKFKELYE